MWQAIKAECLFILGRRGARGVGEAKLTVNLVGETHVIVPAQIGVHHRSLQCGAHKHLAAHLETEGIHTAQHIGRQGTVVTDTVGHHDGADTAMKVGHILIV